MTDALPEVYPPHRQRAERLLKELGLDDHLLRTTFSHSPYLARIAAHDKAFTTALLAQAPAELMAQINKEIDSISAHTQRADLMRFLRQQKKRAALLIALADIQGVWSVEQVMTANTSFADACVQACVRHLIAAEPHIKNTSSGGLVVLGMGKYGAGELNYSSDIDIIILYDAAIGGVAAGAGHKVYPALVRELARMLQEMTADGYVFRVDLSLRPDPGTTQAAVSIEGAHAYYETVGQNWERAAFIKARVVGGDEKLGLNFLKEISDFIWRKYLDYAVLQDIHAMKRQAHAAIGWDETKVELEGRDIKRAAGGIRDIEMFVQSQQLIAGGRDRLLRRQQTCVMLARLAARKWISKAAAKELIAAYRFFRKVEHRLQMIADEQTHTLPVAAEDWEQLALFCGFANSANFKAHLLGEINKVLEHYGLLFKEAPALSTEKGALVFTGGEDDPETLQTLKNLGFSDAKAVAGLIRAWHRGRIPAATSARTRELLTELVPHFLKELSRASDQQTAFLRLDRFLSGLHSAVQFFSLLLSNPALIELIVLICDAAPRLADDLAKNPQMIEALFLPQGLSSSAELLHDLESELSTAKHYEEVLDRARLWVAEKHFHLAIEILKQQNQGLAAAKQFSYIAEAAMIALQQHALAEFAARTANPAAGEMAVVAAGSLGAQEMTIISDLDLIFIYETPESNNTYWIGATQNIVRALTTQTSKGGLFDVDMRLRPSGKAGPVAISLERFISYQKEQAWVWEHMALTRMRPLAGSARLQEKISAAIREVLTQPRDETQLKKEVREMRARIAESRPPCGAWDVSATRGGLVDIEFICQYFQLRYGAAHPEILHHSTTEAFSRMEAVGALREAVPLSALREAEIFYKQIVQLLYLSVGRVGEDEEIPPPLQTLLLEATGTDSWRADSERADSWRALKDKRQRTYDFVRHYFSDLFEK